MQVISIIEDIKEIWMSEYESGTFRCKDCGKEFLTKEAADRHHSEQHHTHIVGE